MELQDILQLPFDEQEKYLCVQKDEHKKEEVEKYLNQFNGKHEILNRKNKTIRKDKTTEETIITAKLVVPIQKKIVTFASGFLFGKPVKYVLNDEKYDEIRKGSEVDVR